MSYPPVPLPNRGSPPPPQQNYAGPFSPRLSPILDDLPYPPTTASVLGHTYPASTGRRPYLSGDFEIKNLPPFPAFVERIEARKLALYLNRLHEIRAAQQQPTVEQIHTYLPIQAALKQHVLYDETQLAHVRDPEQAAALSAQIEHNKTQLRSLHAGLLALGVSDTQIEAYTAIPPGWEPHLPDRMRFGPPPAYGQLIP